MYSQDVKQDSLDNLLQQAKQNNSWKTTISLLYNKGKLYYSENNYEPAEKHFLSIDSIAKHNSYMDKNTVMALLLRANISRNTFTYDGTETANILGEEALSNAKKLNDEALIFAIYKDLAYTKNLKDDHTEAKAMLDLAFQYYLKQEDHKSISWLYRVYASHYNDVDSLKKSEAIRKEHLMYFRTHTDSLELANALGGLGYFYRLKMNQCEKAMPYLQEAKIIFENIQLTNIRSYLYLIENLAICHADRNEYPLAYEYYKQAYNLRKDIVRESNKVTTRQLEAKHQAIEKEQEIALLKSLNELSQQQKTNERYMLLGGIGLTSIAGLFFFFLYRNRQKTANKLQELDAFKSKFFANISHEFRTPLTLISGPIDKRLEHGELSDEDRNELQMIQRNSNRLLNLVNQLLDLSKLESGHLKLKVVQGNLSLLLKAITSSFQLIAKQKNIHYTLDIAEMDQAWFDKDVIEKTVINLLSNAFKYTPEGGYVRCSTSIIENRLEFCIENYSHQITKTQIENIFNRFYQADENAQGVGIGLSLVKELVTLSYGEISVESPSVNSILFKVDLPIFKENFHPNDLVEDPFIPSAIETNYVMVDAESPLEESIDEDLPILLVVDDQEDIRNFIKSAFKNTYQVVVASHGDIGVEKAIELIPDIIISDVMMPICNGFQLTETLKQDERTCHIPIILLTAKADDADRFMGLETGADDYLVKPFKMRGLETRVKNLINSRLKLRERYSQEIVLRPKDIAISNFDEQFLEKIQDVLDHKLTESSFNIEEFSKSVGLSRMQLHRKLKALTGLSATEFIRSQRLKLATDLLKKSDANVSEIGYTVGFNDPSYFSKCFKEAYGCSPSDFAL
ncbi:response regulator [Xanthomarina sp. F2636L]|uniref:response regulator n=1 Tax=Xanthomarina sp. F2636L TaxID=2996018 RepID=UPI00225E4DE6|nr:response regulator [Xanthomarina sp. F2636L]